MLSTSLYSVPELASGELEFALTKIEQPGLSLIVNFPETASGEGASSTGETRQILGDLSCSLLHGVMKSRTLVGRKQIESAHRLQRFLGQGFEISFG